MLKSDQNGIETMNLTAPYNLHHWLKSDQNKLKLR